MRRSVPGSAEGSMSFSKQMALRPIRADPIETLAVRSDRMCRTRCEAE
jgi:hypothetical protein